nr:PREDICTED: coiled-coil domain-containing protein 170 [Lepisosteus oculatus]
MNRSDSGSRLIDVNRNDAFRSFSPTANNRLIGQLQDQLNTLKRQLEEKEELILTLTTDRYASRPDSQKAGSDPLMDMSVTREHLNQYRLTAEAARSDLAALQIKHEGTQTELLDIKSRLASREAALQELKGELDLYKENNARQASLISSLREQVQATEQESGVMASSKTRLEITFQALIKENNELKQKVQDLEDKLQMYISEWDESKHHASSSERKLQDFLSRLASRMNIDWSGKEDPQDVMVSLVDELYKDNDRQRCQIASLKECVSAHEVESKASRETVMRLVSEVSREQRAAVSCRRDLDTLRPELDSTIQAKTSLERENQLLQERLEATRSAWEASKQELSSLKKHSQELNGNLRNSLSETKSAQGLLQAFREDLATLLSGRSGTVHPTEEAIRERIREICSIEENKKEALVEMEAKASRVTEQLARQTELHEAALQRARQAEQQLGELRDRLKGLEGELVSGDVVRDGLSQQKQTYLRFLEELSEKMKLDRVATDLGFDMRVEAILSRAEQLVKLEATAVLENKTLVHNLQRKLKSQKERLESRELHMELLRKKVAQLEEEKRSRTAVAVERDEANLTVRKLQKKVERLQKELDYTRLSNTELKAQLSYTNELKIKTMEQNQTIEELNKSLDKLEKVKLRAEKRLTTMKSELDVTEHITKEEKQRAQSLLESLTSELKTLKHTLEDLAKRERQLLDFREVVSQMVGLNVNTLALPDYEIIKRLEGLIHGHPWPSLCHHHSQEQFSQDFTAGYNHARRMLSASPKALTAPSQAERSTRRPQ